MRSEEVRKSQTSTLLEMGLEACLMKESSKITIMSDLQPTNMPAGFQEWLRSALADSLPSALAALRETQQPLHTEMREASSDSDVSHHSAEGDCSRKRPWSDAPTPKVDKGKAPLKKSKCGSLPLLPSAEPLDTSREDFRILDEYRAGNSKPGTSRSRSPDYLISQLPKDPEVNPDLPVEIMDSSGFPLFDPRTLRHPRSAEWSPPQHVADFLRYWLRRPLDKEVRQKLRAECPRPSLPDKVSSTPEFDPTFVTFMMKNGKDPRKGLEGLRTTQDKLLDVSGPLTQLFIMADEALTNGSQMDSHLAREWAQRALCLLGNANTAISTERRKAALFKLDSKLAELASKELGPDAKGLLFGTKFLKNLSQHVNIFTSLNKAQSSLKRVFQSRDRFSYRAGRQRGRATSRAAFSASRPRLQESSSYRFQARPSYRTPYYRGPSRSRGSASYRSRYPADFSSPPLQLTPPHPIHMSQSDLSLVHEELSALRDKGAIERACGDPCFVSNMFLVRKKSGEFRPVINLRSLNQHVTYRHFKIEGIHLLRDLLRERDWFSRLDLKDAYLTVPVHRDHRRFLQFFWQKRLWQFTCLPFGLSSAPWCFTKLLKPVMEFLRPASDPSSTWTTSSSCPGTKTPSTRPRISPFNYYKISGSSSTRTSRSCVLLSRFNSWVLRWIRWRRFSSYLNPKSRQ
ncbi:LOW QUALITY PROTEIN: uncharacterized protein RCH25_043896 [Pelodytes ibericus]